MDISIVKKWRLEAGASGELMWLLLLLRLEISLLSQEVDFIGTCMTEVDLCIAQVSAI
jgi:hypothetical protein